MTTFKNILKSAFTDTARLVLVTPDYVEVDRSWNRLEFHSGCIRLSSSLTARGAEFRPMSGFYHYDLQTIAKMARDALMI